ncbi:MAG: nuclear transport factor 2 family protein [Acidobacteria bacterium]|nr:nuclear transport factor 2 family protein [Acidobacteriota bacterium]
MKLALQWIVLLCLVAVFAEAQSLPENRAPIVDPEQERHALDPKAVSREVEQAFNDWKEAYSEGDTENFLLGFAQIPDLTIRISASEWIGYDSYREALTQVEMPKTDFPFREVRIIPIDEFAAMVTYVRSSTAKDEEGNPLSFRGTLVYAKTYSGWKLVAWHSHALVEQARTKPAGN